MCLGVGSREVRAVCRNLFLLPTVWVSGFELSFSGLAATAFTSYTISLALRGHPDEKDLTPLFSQKIERVSIR